MTNKTTAALKLAEEALDELHYSSGTVKAVTLYKSALAAIREALAEPVKQEPVAVISESAIGLVKLHSNGACLPFGTQLYAAPVEPVKQEPVAYTNKEQVNELIKESARLIGSIKDEGDQYLTAIDALRNAYRIGLKDSPVDAKAIRAEEYQQGRNEMKEEAAKVCDEHAAKAKANGYTVKGETFIDGFGDGSCACAAAIRGLK